MSTRTLWSLFAFLALFALLCVLALGYLKPSTAPLRTIVLLTPDTLSRDHVRAYAPADSQAQTPETPHMDRLAADGLRFDDARTPVPLTLPAHATMLSGLPPAQSGVRLNTYGRLPSAAVRGYPLLQERLTENGWKTAAFVSAAVLGTRYGLDQGFAHYDDALPGAAGGSRLTVQERPGEATVDAALAWLAARPADERTFLWVHLFEPHAPYAADETYAGDVAAVDTVVGRLLDGLERIGRGDAAILLAADHGEALGELSERTHGLLLADGVLRVPFLLRAPGIKSGVRTDPVDLADVAATLAGLAGVPWDGAGWDLLAAQAPADRIRLAESLYGHHRFRWAQLIAAHGPSGTLVDVGRDRLHWLPASPHGVRLARTALVQETPEIRRQAKAIAEYKQGEVQERMRAGQAAGGYGGGGPVTPFLSSEENARLPDPYTSIGRALLLDQLKAIVSSPRLGGRKYLDGAIQKLVGMNKRHLGAGNPELHFWLGMAYLARARLLDGEGAADLERAEAAFTRAFELGRKDTQTLVRACGVNAQGREEAALGKLESLSKQLAAPGCQYWILKIRLLKTLDREAEAEAACKAGEETCTSPRERELWLKTCR